MRFAVHCPAQLRYESPLLYLVHPSSSLTHSYPTGTSPASTAVLPVGPLIVEISSRKTVAELKETIMLQYASQLGELGVDAPNLVVTSLQRFGEGYYPLSTAADATQLCDVCGAGTGGSSGTIATSSSTVLTHLLLWPEGGTLRDQPVLTGLQGFPKHLRVSLLSPATTTPSLYPTTEPGKGLKSPSIEETTLFPSLYLPSSLSLLDFAHRICDLCQINRMHGCISVLTVTSSSNSNGTSKSDALTYTAIPLYNNGAITNRALTGASPAWAVASSAGLAQHSATATGAGMVMTSHSALGEFHELYTVLVEDAENRGLQGTSLYDTFALQKTAEIGVTIELDFTPTCTAAAETGPDKQKNGVHFDDTVTHVQVSVYIEHALNPTIVLGFY